MFSIAAEERVTASYPALNLIRRLVRWQTSRSTPATSISTQFVLCLRRQRSRDPVRGAAEAARAAAECAPVRPDGTVLHTTQHRIREKSFLASRGFPVTPFRAVSNAEELRTALEALGCPAILKTAGFGYDGKGQEKILSFDQIEASLARAGSQEMILEEFVDFESELSVIGARSIGSSFPIGALSRTSIAGTFSMSQLRLRRSPEHSARSGRDHAGALEELDVIGVLCVEFFLAGTESC
jgi:5-(carboxyamino)imidazole ribonucleotide synthase